jgi:hypothetical protein
MLRLRGPKSGFVGRPIVAAAAFQAALGITLKLEGRLKAGCRQHCPPYMAEVTPGYQPVERLVIGTENASF